MERDPRHASTPAEAGRSRRRPLRLVEGLDILERRRRILIVTAAVGILGGLTLSILLPAMLPRTALAGAVVGVVSLLVAVGLAAAVDSVDARVRGPRHVRACGADLVALLPIDVDEFHADELAQSVVDARRAASVLRLGLSAVGSDPTAALEWADALAVSLARTGSSVLLVDLASKDGGRPGLSEVLEDVNALNDVVTYASDLRLARIGAGSDPHAALLGVGGLMERTPRDVDFALVVLPAVSSRAVVNAARELDQVIVIAERHLTSRVDLIATLDVLAAAGHDSQVALIDDLTFRRITGAKRTVTRPVRPIGDATSVSDDLFVVTLPRDGTATEATRPITIRPDDPTARAPWLPDGSAGVSVGPGAPSRDARGEPFDAAWSEATVTPPSSDEDDSGRAASLDAWGRVDGGGQDLDDDVVLLPPAGPPAWVPIPGPGSSERVEEAPSPSDTTATATRSDADPDADDTGPVDTTPWWARGSSRSVVTDAGADTDTEPADTVWVDDARAADRSVDTSWSASDATVGPASDPEPDVVAPEPVSLAPDPHDELAWGEVAALEDSALTAPLEAVGDRPPPTPATAPTRRPIFDDDESLPAWRPDVGSSTTDGGLDPVWDDEVPTGDMAPIEATLAPSPSPSSQVWRPEDVGGPAAPDGAPQPVRPSTPAAGPPSAPASSPSPFQLVDDTTDMGLSTLSMIAAMESVLDERSSGSSADGAAGTAWPVEAPPEAVAPPVAPPVAAPVAAPVAPPVAAPVAAPVAPPVAPPVAERVTPPVGVVAEPTVAPRVPDISPDAQRARAREAEARDASPAAPREGTRDGVVTDAADLVRIDEDVDTDVPGLIISDDVTGEIRRSGEEWPSWASVEDEEDLLNTTARIAAVRDMLDLGDDDV